MAVPSSGELSLLGIRREVSGNNYNSSTNYTNISLEDLSDGTVATINTSNASSDRPDGSAPHAMTEFYAYDHDLSAGTSLSNIPSGFTLSGQTGLGAQFVYSDEQTFTLTNGLGALTVDISSIAANTGTLAVAMSTTTDPTTSGTGGDGTGFINEGTQVSKNVSWTASGHTIRLRFRYTKASAAHSADVRVVTLTNNSVTATFNVTVETNPPKSDFRVKTNLNKIGHSSMGIPIYLFNYKDDLSTRYKGVVAQDLISMGITEPIGVRDGHYTVDYSKIDVDMEMI
jgi:hypothetical protein